MHIIWEDVKGNLYEAIVLSKGTTKNLRLKKWDKKGRKSSDSEAHTFLFNAQSPPAKYLHAIENLRNLCFKNGCPRKKLYQD